MRTLSSSILVAALLGLLPASVSAGVPGWTWSWLDACGGENFETCMSGSIAYNGAGLITVVVENVTPYDGDIFTAVGLFNLPVGVLPTSYASTMAWTPTTHLNGGGLPGSNSRRYALGTNGVGGGFGEGHAQTFTFTFAATHYASLQNARNTIGVGIHAQSGPLELDNPPDGTCSTKLGVQSGGVVDNANPDEYSNCRDVSVPEPGSMALLVTGLAGLAFVSRRRREDELEG